MSCDDIKQYIIAWNNRFPYDRWWRLKHGVAFMSPEHREANFLFQVIEFQEDLLYKEFAEKGRDGKEYRPNCGEYFKDIDVTNLPEEEYRKKAMESAIWELKNLPKKI